MTAIDVANVSFKYEIYRPNVLHDVSFTVEHNSITGLLGRNGCGKSTLSLLIAGLLHPGEGQVLIDGQDVYENPRIMPTVSYMGDDPCIFDDEKIKETFALWRDTRAGWDDAFAYQLLDMFAISPKKKPNKLSRGQRSAFYATLGMASRCPVTIFDEVHLGMDAVARELFYRTLLEDYTRYPRTILLSSHLIEEIDNLLDHVVFLDQGRVVEMGDVDEVRMRHMLDGRLPNLTEVLMDLTITDEQRSTLGRSAIQ